MFAGYSVDVIIIKGMYMWLLVVILFLYAPLGGMIYSKLSEDIHNMDMSTSSPIIVMAGVMGSLFGILPYFVFDTDLLAGSITVLLTTFIVRMLASLKVTHGQMGLDKKLVLGLLRIEVMMLSMMSIIGAALYTIANYV